MSDSDAPATHLRVAHAMAVVVDAGEGEVDERLRQAIRMSDSDASATHLGVAHAVAVVVDAGEGEVDEGAEAGPRDGEGRPRVDRRHLPRLG